jgi:hypothetical protein
MTVFCQHAPNHVLVDIEAEYKAKLLGYSAAAPTRIESVGLDNDSDQFRRRAPGAGFATPLRFLFASQPKIMGKALGS